jgi:acyl carrier protein
MRDSATPLLYPTLKESEVKPVEELRSIWMNLLGVTVIRDEDDFFELGGDSLKGIELVFLVEQRFGVTLDQVEILRQPTFGGFFRVVDAMLDVRLSAAGAMTDTRLFAGKF